MNFECFYFFPFLNLWNGWALGDVEMKGENRREMRAGVQE